jgi:hypothetical protein
MAGYEIKMAGWAVQYKELRWQATSSERLAAGRKELHIWLTKS